MKNYSWLNNWLDLPIYLGRIKKIISSFVRSILVIALGINFFQIALGETFSPDRVSLPQDVISSPFEAPRNSGPHKGTDISENMRNPTKFQPFSAGVWGVIVPPLGGPWGTITINPFVGANHKVQHLHSSSVNVSVGDIVSPWSILGSTGTTAPPGIPISGVHLHIQVADEAGTPKYPEWDRAYVNPTSWDTGNPFKLPGDAMWAWKAMPMDFYGLIRNGHQYLKFEGDKIDDPVALTADYTFSKEGNFFCRTEYRFRGNIVKRKINTIIARFVYQDSTCTERCKCHPSSPEETEFGLNRLGKVDWPAASRTHKPENIVSGVSSSRREGIQQEISGKKFDPKDTIDLIIGVSDILKK